MLRRVGSVLRSAARVPRPVIMPTTTFGTGSADGPVMGFLAHPDNLNDCVQPTVGLCKQLIEELLHKPHTPQEKHDLIDSMSNVLCLLLDPCEFVRQTHPDERYRNAAGEAFQQGHDFLCEANSRRDLYDVILDISKPENLATITPEAQRNVHQLRRDMEGNGIHLDDAQRREIVKLNQETEQLGAEFLMQDKNHFAALRNLVVCRHELATKLGFESFADKALRGSLLETPQEVWHFLCAVGNKYRPAAEQEVNRLRSHLGEVKGRPGNLTDEDRAKLTISLQREYANVGDEVYFTVANCIRGAQVLLEEVFDLKLKEVDFDEAELLPTPFRKFHCLENSGKLVGVIVLDMFARASKHCQAGHLTVQLGCRPHNNVLKSVGVQLPERQYPIVMLTCNAGSAGPVATRANGAMDDEATVMTPHEVTTFFHEFGHAVHTLLGQTTVQNLSGTRASIDFVEMPSQFFEQFLTSHEFLKLWAHKIGTREPISPDIVARRTEVRNMFRHLEVMDQVLLASIDQSLHGPQPFTVYFPTSGGHLGKRTLGTPSDYGRGIYNLAKLIMDMCNPISVVTPTERGVLRSLSFDHLVSYPAGYYGYLYSSALAHRIYDKNFRDKPMNRVEGQRLAQEVLSHGAACEPKERLCAYLKEDINDIEAWV